VVKLETHYKRQYDLSRSQESLLCLKMVLGEVTMSAGCAVNTVELHKEVNSDPTLAVAMAVQISSHSDPVSPSKSFSKIAQPTVPLPSPIPCAAALRF
jgi:hypothetical protein